MNRLIKIAMDTHDNAVSTTKNPRDKDSLLFEGYTYIKVHHANNGKK